MATYSAAPSSNSPQWLKSINRLAQILHLGAANINSLRSVDLLLAKHGYADTLDDEGKERLAILLNALNTEKLSYVGAIALNQLLKEVIENWLTLRDAQSHAPLSNVQIHAPVFIIGFPRTGTTMLHNLMACDSRFCAPKMWELHQPALSKDNAAKREMKRKVKMFARMNNIFAPNMQNIHPIDANNYEECLKLLENSLLSPTFMMYNDAPVYQRWLQENTHSQRIIDVYREHKFQLRLLQENHSKKGRWLLKSPAHALWQQALTQVYPDATIISTLREPEESISSFCSLALTTRSMFDNCPDAKALGEFAMTFFSQAEKERQRIVDAKQVKIIDVEFRALVSDPLKVTRKIYETLNLEMTTEALESMTNYVEKNAKENSASHQYSPQMFGLSDVSKKFPEVTSRLASLRVNDGVALAS